MLKRQHILALLFCAVPATGQTLGDRLDAYLRGWEHAGYLSGTILVARGDSVLYERSFGWANRELRVPFAVHTRSNIASITKPMTIAIAARMIEDGLLETGQTLDRWIPDFPRADRITVSHLLNHRAGIPHRVTTDAQETVPRSAADMVAFARVAEQLPHEPGAVSVYSSAGFSVLARVLELAGDADYGALLARYVTSPTGMTRTTHGSARDLVPDRAAAYAWSVDGLVNAPLQDLSYLVGAGSVFSTPRDLFRMMRAVINGDLGEVVRGALLRETGLHWNGSTSGYRAWADWDRATGVAIVLMANMQSGANDRIRQDLARVVAGESIEPEVPTPPVAAAVPRTTLARYDGTYELRPGSPMPVRAADGGLWVDQWFLIPTSDTTFFSPQDFGVVTARFDDARVVTHFDWEFLGGRIAMRKVER